MRFGESGIYPVLPGPRLVPIKVRRLFPLFRKGENLAPMTTRTKDHALRCVAEYTPLQVQKPTADQLETAKTLIDNWECAASMFHEIARAAEFDSYEVTGEPFRACVITKRICRMLE